ncbi:MAG TPA: thioesterase family protein [Dehalococcoidia bacterium]|nr:thioesterase family protein [Dehalococcoidia bacterium]
MIQSTDVTIVVKSTDLGSDQYVRSEVYFTYFEQSRLEHLRRLGIVPVFPPPPSAPNYFAIVETTARYRQPARFGDTLTVRTTTEAVGTRSFTFAFRCLRQGTNEVLAEGQSVQVWLGADRRPAPIPPEPRARLEASRPATN